MGFGKLLLMVAVVLSVTEDALAWGPATHVGLANSILDQISILPVSVAAIINRHRLAYMYGNIAADVVFAKRLSKVKQFCHHWTTAFQLLDHAEKERDTAFAYGYLSHLAADTVAHNKYVPRQIIVSNLPVNYGHFYWELRADAKQGSLTWSSLEHLLTHDHSDHHETLSDHIVDTFLPYDLNRLLFERMNMFAVKRGFQRTIHVWNRFSRRNLSTELLNGYWGESIDRIQSILTEGQRSALVHEDPNGTSALMQIKVQKRAVRRMKRGGLPINTRLSEISHGLSPIRRLHSTSSSS